VSRYRLYPTPEQEEILRKHCAHARFVWNLGLEQRLMYRPGRGPTPGYYEQKRQLTEARAAETWLGAGSVTVQHEALADLDQAWRNFFRNTHRKPTWRKAGRNEGFRIVGKPGKQWGVRRLNRKWGEVRIPKIGWVRFRWSRAVPECKSYRVTMGCANRWHVAFTAVPAPVPGPGTGEVVGVDRGIVITAALSDGKNLHCPGLSSREQARLRKAQRHASRAPKNSDTRSAECARVARLMAREADIRKDWCEKVSTDLARRFDVIRIEDLRIVNMTRKVAAVPDLDRPGQHLRNGGRAKSGLNRAILAQGWGMLARRTEQKAPGRVEKVPAAYTSLRCSDCGWIDKNSRKSQAEFACDHCGFSLNADTNAALNIAAGHAGGTSPSVRGPQLDLRVA
jgi:transposase